MLNVALVPACTIDHITIVSPSLEVGGALVHELLGVRPQVGGEHPRMGTHNLLLRLGDALFLEVIAVNPAAPQPGRSRWFELDELPSCSKPHLGCWVARTEDIYTSLAGASERLGEPEPMSRGSLEWLISIPEDGRLPMSGTAPALIQWKTSVHPAMGLQDMGCKLVKLDLVHPEPKRLGTLIGSLHFAETGASLSVGEASAPGLVAHIDTPFGLRTIGAPSPLQGFPR